MLQKVFFEASKILSVQVEYCRLFPAPSLSGKWGRDVWPWWMVVPASSSYRVPPSFLQIPIPLRQRSPPHRHLLMSFLQQSSDPSTVHCTVQHPNKTLFRVNYPSPNSFKPLKNIVLVCNQHRSGRPLRINLMSWYICFSQNGRFDVSFEELFSKAKNPGGFFRNNVF